MILLFASFLLAFCLMVQSFVLWKKDKKKIPFFLWGTVYLVFSLFLLLSSDRFFFHAISSPWISLASLLCCVSICFFLHPLRLFSFHLLFCLWLTLLSSFSALQSSWKEPQTLVLLQMSGQTNKEWIEWKSPSSPLQKELLSLYEVTISFPGYQQKEFFFGEVIGIRYKRLELHSFLHWMGYKDPILIEGLYSDYLSLDKKKTLPSKVIQVPVSPSFFSSLCWRLWERLFYKGSSLGLIRGAKLQTTFFPLVHPDGRPMKQTFSLKYE